MMVSIVLPTYNGYRFLQRSIDSCLTQSYENIELIIVDDGSSDPVKSLVDKYSDPRVKYFRNDENMGISESLNRGFEKASGEYFTWTSDDNIYRHDAIEKMVEKIENESLDFVYADFYEIDEADQIIREVKVRPPETLKEVNYIGLCFLYKRDIFDSIGGYDRDAFLVEDYEYWLRIFYNNYRMAKIDEFLYSVRMHEKCLTVKYDSKYIEWKAQLVRDRYIPSYLSLYQHGVWHYYNDGDFALARKSIVRAILWNPFFIKAWRMLMLVTLSDSTINLMRRIKHFFCKDRE